MTTEAEQIVELTAKLGEAERFRDYHKDRCTQLSEDRDYYHNLRDDEKGKRVHYQSLLWVSGIFCLVLLVNLGIMTASTVVGQMIIGVICAAVACVVAFVLYHMVRDVIR